MLSIQILSTSVVLSKFFAASDKDAVLAAIPADARRVLFVDTGSTPVLAETVLALVGRGVEVHLRDHHRGEGRTPEAAAAIEAILGGNARIVTRREAAGCALLVEASEFAGEGTVIVADPDPDGLLAAMKAAGVAYPGLEADAAVVDGPRSEQTPESLTAFGLLFTRAMSSLPPFNPAQPEVAEKAKTELFSNFVKVALGDTEAKVAMEKAAEAYEVGVKVAKAILATATEVAPGVVMVDTCQFGRHDLTTLTDGMNRRPGCWITVIRKPVGPLAAKFGGIQYSLAVPPTRQKELDIRSLVPEGTEVGMEAGLLANTAFLLHCSTAVWEGIILPALRARFSE